ncbi:nucleotidyltransferase family protein [Williamsia sterculiae]|uniref:nucleotidyltransferase family protein n=1 Tax=Williamsia sterculiae TaxID=1344003 RepID=UPI0013564F1B|nr:nucleotidyltransferase family protein [Williamsia sterculiae]
MRRSHALSSTALSSTATFLDEIRQNPMIVRLVDELPALDLPDWFVAGGALMQTVWNVRTRRPVNHGILDYDVLYFDDSDLSEAAEQVVIDRVAAVFGADVQIRNQARVHHWYADKFGMDSPVRPLRDSRDGIDQFVAPCVAVGVTRSDDGELTVYAPFGLDDMNTMIIRHNVARASREAFDAKATRWRSRWPEVTID